MNEIIAKITSCCPGFSGNIRYLVDGNAYVELCYDGYYIMGETVDTIENILSQYFDKMVVLYGFGISRGGSVTVSYMCAATEKLENNYE